MNQERGATRTKRYASEFIAAAYERHEPQGGGQLARSRSPKLAALATFARPPDLLTRFAGRGSQCIAWRIWMTAGPIITKNRQGRKKMIMGTVSLAGREAALRSASCMRISRFSVAVTRSAWPSGVPYFSAWFSAVATALTPIWPQRLARLSQAWRRSGR